MYFRFVPGAAEDIYDNIFVTYQENKKIIEERKKTDRCFNCVTLV